MKNISLRTIILKREKRLIKKIRDILIMEREYIRFIIRSAKYMYREIYVCHWFNYDWTNLV